MNEYAFIAISAKSNIHIPEVSRYHAVFKKSRLLKSTFKGPVQQPKHTAKKLIPEFFFSIMFSAIPFDVRKCYTGLFVVVTADKLVTNLLQRMIRNCVNRTAF